MFASDPPCTSEKEGEVGCCKLFGSAFRRSNLPQILTIMKYSLELSDPWISQYHSYREHAGKNPFGERRELHRLWITDDDEELGKFMVNASSLDRLHGWRYGTHISLSKSFSFTHLLYSHNNKLNYNIPLVFNLGFLLHI